TVIVCGEAGKVEARQNYYPISDFEQVVNALDRFVLRDAALFPASADLRVSHVCKEGLHFYMLVNEGEQLYHGTLQTNIFGKVHKWDPWAGTIVEQCLEGHEQGPRIPLQLDRRQSIVFCVDPLQKPVIADHVQSKLNEQKIELHSGWRVNGTVNAIDPETPLSSWADWSGMEHFSGTVTYHNTFDLKDVQEIQSAVLDLGDVHEIAQVWINDQEAGVILWSPYQFDIRGFLKAGTNQIKVEVTNSMANRFDELMLPSGLLGPVTITTNNKQERVAR
ncbi:MAG: hypothetical protein JWN30_984, partial [Bacilli bacterium]|nr:hypothetical protein [Bacilli bacterium]